MKNAMEAVRQLLEKSAQVSGSPLADIRRFYFGDPIKIPQSSLPALIVHPIATGWEQRGSQYDMKTHTIEVRLVYNVKQYLGSDIESGSLAITGATYSAPFITFTTAAPHGLSPRDIVVTEGFSPDPYNTTARVESVTSPTVFSVEAATSPTPVTVLGGYRLADSDRVHAVEDAIEKMEALDGFHETAKESVCGAISSNVHLPLTLASGETIPTANHAKVRTVTYGFTQSRGFPTFEVAASIEAQIIGDR